MKLTEEQYELLEAYLQNELSPTDQVSFEKDIEADPELRAEVNRQREIRLGLRALGIQQALHRAQMQYHDSLAVTQPEADQQTVVRPLSTWRYWAAAASFVLISGIGYYAYQQTDSRQADLAYTETFRADDELLKRFPSATVSPQTRKTFLDAITHYRSGNYERVVEQLRTLPADKQTIPYKNYLLGLSYLASKQSAEAIPFLIRAQKTSLPELHRKAEWFLALAYVKNNQKERALPILKRISTEPAHPFQSLAQRVLLKIQ